MLIQGSLFGGRCLSLGALIGEDTHLGGPHEIWRKSSVNLFHVVQVFVVCLLKEKEELREKLAQCEEAMKVI